MTLPVAAGCRNVEHDFMVRGGRKQTSFSEDSEEKPEANSAAGLVRYEKCRTTDRDVPPNGGEPFGFGFGSQLRVSPSVVDSGARWLEIDCSQRYMRSSSEAVKLARRNHGQGVDELRFAGVCLAPALIHIVLASVVLPR